MFLGARAHTVDKNFVEQGTVTSCLDRRSSATPARAPFTSYWPAARLQAGPWVDQGFPSRSAVRARGCPPFDRYAVDPGSPERVTASRWREAHRGSPPLDRGQDHPVASTDEPRSPARPRRAAVANDGASPHPASSRAGCARGSDSSNWHVPVVGSGGKQLPGRLLLPAPVRRTLIEICQQGLVS